MLPKLELRDVTVRRSARTVLEVERLSLEQGEVLAVLGPNGAGKSTLLQVAALLLRPRSGEVLIDGRPARGDSLALRRRMAVAMQDALLVDGSVLDNVALGLKLRGVPRHEREVRALAWLERFGIRDLAKRPASRVSGGEAQRASLARAFAIEPEVLFLDEPFGGLDEPTRESLLDDLSAVVRQTAVTTVFVTHDRDEALHLAGRVAVVLEGRLRQEGTPAEVFGTPSDREVAAFMGVENILPGRLVETRGGLASVEVVGRRLFGPARDGLLSEVVVCLRPESVTLQPATEAAAPGVAGNALSGVVQDVRPRGADARVALDCGFPLVALIPRMSADDLHLAPGTPVIATFKVAAVHLMPASPARQACAAPPS